MMFHRIIYHNKEKHLVNLYIYIIINNIYGFTIKFTKKY